jgi:anti-sigma factor RsiW
MDSDHLLMAYVDGELDEATAREVERRLVNDPQVHARVEFYRETTSLIRSALGDARFAPTVMLLHPAQARLSPWQRRAVLALLVSIAVGMLGFEVGRMIACGG